MRVYHAVDHCGWIAEKILVVRALCGAVSHHQGGLSAAACAARALHVIGWRRWDIPKIDDVEFGNVYTEFHRRRAKQDWQESARFAHLKGSRADAGWRCIGERTALGGTKAETVLAHGPNDWINLCSVFPCLQYQQRMLRVCEEVGEHVVLRCKERVGTVYVATARVETNAAVVQAIARHVEIGVLVTTQEPPGSRRVDHELK